MQTMLFSLEDRGGRFNLVVWSQALLVLLLSMVCTAQAQRDEFIDPLASRLSLESPEKAEFTAVLTPATAKPGDEVTLAVSAKLPSQNYIFATTGKFGPLTKITVIGAAGLDPVEGEFQPDRPPEEKLDPVFNEVLSKFHDKVTWTKKFRLAKNAEAAKVAVDVQIEGQWCSEGEGGTCHLIKPPFKMHAVFSEGKPDEKAIRKDVEKANDSSVRFRYKERPIRGDTNPAEFEFQLAPTKESGGKIVKLAITMFLDKGWHTFPTDFSGEGGQPTVITIDAYGLKPIGEDFKVNRPPEIKSDGTDSQEVYHDKVTWSQEFEVIPGGRPNAYGVEGKIKYQVCRSSCQPRNMKFSLGINSDEIDPPTNVGAFEEAVASESPAAGESNAHRPQDQGLLVFLVTAILAGVVALLTPCVFPMVPITVSFFLKQSESKGSQPFKLALVFSLAIIVSFVVIGVGVAAIFGATKPNALATNWILNLFLASIFFVFALNMLGMFEIQVPSWLVTFTATGEQTGGYVGVIFMALTFVLTSFSCTFAFVGSLLASAAKGQYYWPILGMLAFGTTFAAPFFVLALMPGRLKSLPKSGGWLNSVKVVMGFVEMGVAVKYISIVDQVWNSVPWLFDFTNVMTLWSVLSISTGLYLLGLFRLSHDTPIHGLSPVRVILAIGFLMLGGLFGVGLMQPERESWVVDQLVAFAPARLDDLGFDNDYDRAVKTAIAQNRPLFIDFTGVFCPNCRLMEKRMAKSHNQSRLKQFVKVQVYTDLVPNISDEVERARLLKRNVELQIGFFGDVTLPSYAVVTSDGKTILAKFTGLENKVGDFAKFMDEGLTKWETLQAQK